ncbi:carboxylesterase/lipase family protein [Sphingopyxis sp.]|uniref:carboxylesterase/lipase family protein n=1 Tax=Sphingopyxis sp. TaxID=1908224 RepID=UPI0035AFBF58
MTPRIWIMLPILLLLTAASGGVRVDTPQGPVEGQASGDVEIFRGIPYAAPPVGAARWRAPGEAPKWANVRDASAFGPICTQRAPATLPQLKASPQSEDCLTLNIWRPANAKGAPVMLWIHGGANLFGSGSEPYYDGSAFARRGVVLVTINYRLGHLGFFGHPALKGGNENLVNYGLLDQIAALKWVRANIASYGGDPGKVTIFGESAGGAAVLNLMGAPSAKGLFAAAIVQSGGGLVTAKNAASVTEEGKMLAEKMGLREPTIEALRALPADRFIDPALPRPAPGFGAVPGGAEMKEAPLAALRAGRAANVPLIIGVNSNEGSLVDSWGMKDEQVLALLGGRAPAIADAYGKLAADTRPYARRLYGDVIFLYPARAIARAAQKRAPAWLYYFDYVPDAARESRAGVNHAAEIPFVFDMEESASSIARSGKDKAFARGINSCFAAFAVSRDPAKAPFCENWSAYDADADNWFVFRDTPAQSTGLFKRQLDAIGAALRRFGLD